MHNDDGDDDDDDNDDDVGDVSLMVTNNMRPVAEANSVNISQLEPIFLYRDNNDYCDDHDRDNQDNRWASH